MAIRGRSGAGPRRPDGDQGSAGARSGVVLWMHEPSDVGYGTGGGHQGGGAWRRWCALGASNFFPTQHEYRAHVCVPVEFDFAVQLVNHVAVHASRSGVPSTHGYSGTSSFYTFISGKIRKFPTLGISSNILADGLDFK